MKATFEIKRGRRGHIGSLTAQVAADDFDAATERQLVAEYNRTAPARPDA